MVKLSLLFDDFKGTLFAQTSVSFERAVQDAAINKKLDAEISKFLLFLTPYFLLSATHKALEWLIHRYHIHQYNRDQFVLLILPYHETRMFVRYVLFKMDVMHTVVIIGKIMHRMFLILIKELYNCSTCRTRVTSGSGWRLYRNAAFHCLRKLLSIA